MSAWRLIPPAGTPFGMTDFARMLGSALSMTDGGAGLRALFRESTGARHCYLFNSGRAALLYALRALAFVSPEGKNEVVIPAYTCFSVASAVARAGLKIRLVDIDLRTLDYDYSALEKLDAGKTLAIVGCNLFGVLNDWTRLRAIAESKGVFLIDDAAQSLGSRYQGCPSGTLGDIGFFSLGRGKNLSAYAGGVLITSNDAIAERLSRETEKLKSPGVVAEMKSMAQIGLYGLFLRPRVYWIPQALPFLRLGETVYDEGFEVGSLARFQGAAAATLFSRIDRINEIRRRNAAAIAAALTGDIVVPGLRASECPIYLRLPLLVKDRRMRDLKIEELKRGGIGASAMYPSTIGRIVGIEKHLAPGAGAFPGAEEVAERLLTVPTNPYVDDKAIEKIARIMNAGDGAEPVPVRGLAKKAKAR